LSPPRNLLTTSVASASPSTSSATISRFEQRQQGLKARQLLFVEQDVELFELGHHLLGVLNNYQGKVPK